MPEIWDELKDFNPGEFDYPDAMDHELLRTLQLVRWLADVPFKINSDFRTIKENKDVNGSENSAHLRGLAVDIACPSSQVRKKILRAMVLLDIHRVGIGKTFIHMDVDLSLPQEVYWVY